MTRTLWQRWKRFAHRAAEIQSFIVLTVVYWLIVTPIGAARKIGRRQPDEVGWKTRPPTGPVPIDDARRQS